MPAPHDAVTRAIAAQYDHFQSSLEALGKEEKFLNFGFTVSRTQSYEQRQARLCHEVFDAAELGPHDNIVDVGFGSGEQDLLLARTRDFGRLTGFNIAERQVRYASERARDLNLGHKLSFCHGEAELLPGVADNSVDKLLAIECAHYFDRPRFYRRAAEVLKPGGRAVLADIALSDHLHVFTGTREKMRRVGTRSANRREWEQHFHTTSVRNINRWTLPGAQQTVFKILQVAPFSGFSGHEQREWLEMALIMQCAVVALFVHLLHYDLIVLEKRRQSLS
jgi:ubiquinone/menaquinone biosynthesis C-methylase UbiE